MDETSIRSAVIRLKAYLGKVDRAKPYQTPQYKEALATGFLLTGGNGLLVTNFHVVRHLDNGRLYRGNPFKLLPDDPIRTVETKRNNLIGYLNQFGARKFYLNVILTCPEYDLAICQFSNPEDIQLVNQTTTGLEIIDSLDIKAGRLVWSAGYPLEESFKITQGNISGISSLQDRCRTEDCRIDDYTRDHCCIQHTAPISGGNSGGPLLVLDEGKYRVIGVICSALAGYGGDIQNVNYAVPSRLVYSAFFGDIFTAKSKLVRRPNNAFRWSILQREFINHRYGQGNSIHGIRICNILADSWIKSLQPGDIIYQLQFTNSMTPTHQIVADIDNDGLVKLDISNRVISINELFELIPFGTEVVVRFYRDNVPMQLTQPFVIDPLTYTLTNFTHYPNWEILEYRIIAGMLFQSCASSASMSSIFDFASKSSPDDTKPYKKVVVISQIFNTSYVKEVGILDEQDIVIEINGITVHTFDQLNQAIDHIKSSGQNHLMIKTKTGKLMYIPMERAMADDTQIRNDLFNR